MAPYKLLEFPLARFPVLRCNDAIQYFFDSMYAEKFRFYALHKSDMIFRNPYSMDSMKMVTLSFFLA